VPGRVLSEVDWLECLFFGGFDPHFEGDEPPGLVADEALPAPVRFLRNAETSGEFLSSPRTPFGTNHAGGLFPIAMGRRVRR
jgi:hypothetical protein